ncbi:MAG TPA: substrate-binding domain-containing protein [Streptosporangiaceae bacterium]|nr:substrate-binding domain-containing protein [Streptosporangiaceae bacterium]
MITPPPGRPKAARRRKRRLRTKSLVFLAVLACVLLMVGRGAAQFVNRLSCEGRPVDINVSVSTDIATPIQQIAQVFNRQNHMADGRCVAVQINPEDPAAAAGQIDGQHPNPAGQAINAWIPDSTLWVDEVRLFETGVQAVNPTGSVAKSPLMIVMPAAAAARTPALTSLGWKLLLPPAIGGPKSPTDLRVDLPDPAQSAAGLATLIEVSRMLGTTRVARLQFTKFAHTAAVTSYFDDPGSLSAFVSLAAPPLNGDPVTVTTEQAVLAYDAANPHQPLAAVYPSSGQVKLGTPEFDYPYVTLNTSSQQELAAANAFGDMLHTAYAANVLRFAGFRSGSQMPGQPDKFPASYGLDDQMLQVATVATQIEAPTVLQAWNKLSLYSKDLVEVDVSSAMSKSSAPGDPSYEAELSQASTLGLALFANTSNLGVWEFGGTASDNKLGYKNLMSIGPLTAQVGLLTRRAALERINARFAATASSRSPFYGTIEAGYKYLMAHYQPKFFNALVVLGSGIENAPGDISGPALVKELTKLYNPDRKISIIMVIFGNPPNFGELQKIAQASGGQAYQITTAAQVDAVFYEALARRLCSPACGA